MAKKLPKGHDISAHKDEVGKAMHRWKHHDPKPLHSGVGKKGKEGKIVKSHDQAVAIALSMAGEGKSKSKKGSDHAEGLTSLGYTEETSERVYEILGDLFDFTRCQRPNGKIYGSPGRCRPPAVEIGAKEEAPKKEKSSRGMRIGKTVKNMTTDQLEALLKDPRVKPHQADKIRKLIADKGGKDQSKKPSEAETAKTSDREEKRKAIREEVKADKKLLEGKPMYQGKTEEALTTLRNSYQTMRELMKLPSFQTNENRARLINTRIAIWETERNLRKGTVGKTVDPKTYEAAVKSSPKYDRVPGSSKPLSKPNPKDIESLSQIQTRLFKKMDEAKSQEEKLRISNEILDVTRRLQNATAGTPLNPSLKDIYKEQGFNAKPELVGTVSDLKSRKDIKTHPDGSPMILYRGVSTKEFADQFRGLGPGGDTHFAGRGIHGNGTYAATASDLNPRGSGGAAIKTAKAYSGEAKDLNQRVTAFALRSDANVVTFRGKDPAERDRAWDKWFDETLERARQETGYRFTDIGEAAAALGIHAYQVPQRGEDFFVVLNRGAVIAAIDPQLSE